MDKNILIIILVIICLGHYVLSFVPFENNKEYIIYVDVEESAFLATTNITIPRHFYANMHVRKSSNDHILVRFKDIDINGHDFIKSECDKPFKLKVAYNEIQSMVTTGNWTKAGVQWKYNLLEEFLEDRSSLTKFLNSSNWQGDLKVNLPLGSCHSDVHINLYENEIKLLAESSKARCVLGEDVLNSLPESVDPYHAITDNSDSSVEITLNRVRKDIKKIEISSKLFVEIENMRVDTISKMSFAYTGVSDVSDEILFEEPLFIHSRDDLRSYT